MKIVKNLTTIAALYALVCTYMPANSAATVAVAAAESAADTSAIKITPPHEHYRRVQEAMTLLAPAQKRFNNLCTLVQKKILRNGQRGVAHRICEYSHGSPVVPLPIYYRWIYGQIQKMELAHVGSVFAIAWSPDGNYVVTGSDDGRLVVWNGVTGNHVRDLKHGGAVAYSIKAINFSSNGLQFVSVDDDDSTRTWETVTGKCIGSASVCSSVPLASWSAQNKYIKARVAYPSDPTTMLLERQIPNESCNLSTCFGSSSSTMQQVQKMGHSAPIISQAWSNDGSSLAVGLNSGITCIWQPTTTNKQLCQYFVQENARMNALQRQWTRSTDEQRAQKVKAIIKSAADIVSRSLRLQLPEPSSCREIARTANQASVQ